MHKEKKYNNHKTKIKQKNKKKQNREHWELIQNEYILKCKNTVYSRCKGEKKLEN